MNQPQRPQGLRTSHYGTALGTLVCASIVILATTTGCSYYSNSLCSAVSPYETIRCDAVYELRSRLRARAIWADKYAKCYRKHCNTRDVREGFVDGFLDTCRGGDGCPPMFAPNGGCSLGLRDKCASAWFEGYPLGVAAAESCGCARRLHSRCHPGLLAGCQNMGCNPGCEPCSGEAGMCGTCGQAGSSCGCNGTGPVVSDAVPVPMPLPEAVHFDSQVESYQGTPELQPGETIVPGSFQNVPSHAPEAEAAPSPEAIAPQPEPDHSAQANDLIPADDTVDTQESEGGIVEMAEPIQWNQFKPASAKINAVNFEDR